MSRIAKKPIIVPNNVNIIIRNNTITVDCNGKLISQNLNRLVKVKYHNDRLFFESQDNNSNGWMQAGTLRSLVSSMILGVTVGFSKKLKLIGVGYRINIEKNNIITMSLGYSHVIHYFLPNDVTAEIISATEIILKSFNKQLLGQVAANLRSKRKPEVYKGKGVRYFDEYIRIKEAKKK
ncbi:50S ribosomal protein L6 [Buchnera aphidicola]|uniref:50S ribosomal protein L6 n=1 Tax=Buchnera aphidicola TaxID=9 RepID=UPI00346473F6